MHPTVQTDPVSKKRLWGGRIIGGLAVLFLLFDGEIGRAHV